MRLLVVVVATLGLIYAQQNPSSPMGTLSAPGISNVLRVPVNDIHTIQLVVTGSPAVCTIKLEGSLDGTNYVDLSGPTVSDCTTITMFHVAYKPMDYVRCNLTALSGGTSPTVSIRYVGTRSGGKQ